MTKAGAAVQISPLNLRGGLFMWGAMGSFDLWGQMTPGSNDPRGQMTPMPH